MVDDKKYNFRISHSVEEYVGSSFQTIIGKSEVRNMTLKDILNVYNEMSQIVKDAEGGRGINTEDNKKVGE